MSGKGGQARSDLRNCAIDMILAGQTTRQVGECLDVHYSLVSRWFQEYWNKESLEDRKPSGRASVQNWISKMVISNLWQKRDNPIENWPKGFLEMDTRCLTQLSTTIWPKIWVPSPSKSAKSQNSLKTCKKTAFVMQRTAKLGYWWLEEGYLVWRKPIPAISWWKFQK